MSLEEGIRRESGGKAPEEVESLCLDQAKCGDGLSSLAPFSNLMSLSIQDAGISSLDTLPALETLSTLKMSDNKIKSGLENLLRLPALEKLYLAGNQISSLEALQELTNLKSLAWLDLEGNPVTKVEGYSKSVFEMLPNLVVLDGKNRDGEEIEEAEDDDEDDDDEDDDDEDDDDERPATTKAAAAADDDDDDDDEEEGDEEEGEAAGGADDGDDDDDEEEEEEGGGGEGQMEYMDYSNILAGNADYNDEEEEDEDFKPEAEPADYDIPEDEEDENLSSVLGKHARDDDK